MAQVPIYFGTQGATYATPGYVGIGDSGLGAINAAQANVELRYRTAGTFSNMSLRVLGSNTSSFTFQINGVNGNQVVNSSASPGIYSDNVNTDIIAAGNTVNESWTPNDTIYCGGIAFLALNPALTVKKLAMINNSVATSVASANTTVYFPVSGNSGAAGNATESLIQSQFYITGTLNNFLVFLAANSMTSAAAPLTMGTRINSVNGNLSVSISFGATGYFEDLINTDIVLNTGAILDYYLTTGATANGSVGCAIIAVELQTGNGMTVVNLATGAASVSFSNFPATYIYGGSAHGFANGTGPFSQSATVNGIISAATVNISVNSLNLTSTLALVINNVTGNTTISIPATSNGFFTAIPDVDLTHAADQLYWSITTASSSGGITLRSIGLTLSTSLPVPVQFIASVTADDQWLGGDEY